MKKVVRLTESDLSRIVRRVIKEEQMSAQMLQAKAESCWDPKKYPQIAGMMKAYGFGLLAVAAAAVTVLSAGAADGMTGGLSVTAALLSGGAAVDQIVKVAKSDSTFKKELTTFYNCMF